MSFDGKSDSHVRVDGGGNQDAVDRGTFKFDGTQLAVELPVRLGKINPGSILTPMPGSAGATAALPSVFIQEAATNGVITVDSDGEITVGRSATAPVDLEVWYHLRGGSKEY